MEKIFLEHKNIWLIIGIIISAVIATRIVRWFINKHLLENSREKPEDATKYKFFRNAVSFIIWLIAIGAIILLIPQLKAVAITIFAGAGIFVAILGLAAQEAFSNIISGIFLVLFKPFRVGDLIKVGAIDTGIVEDITLRHTVLNNFENKRIVIPNSVISSETITNDTIEDTKICRWIEVGISYDSSVDLAINIIQEEAMAHHSCIDNRTAHQIESGMPQIEVRLMSFGDSSVNLRAYVWTNDPFNAVRMQSDIYKRVKKRFDNEGIEIPFPHRTLVYKTDLDKNGK